MTLFLGCKRQERGEMDAFLSGREADKTGRERRKNGWKKERAAEKMLVSTPSDPLWSSGPCLAMPNLA